MQLQNYFPVDCRQGSVAEWSKALVLGTSLSGGVGSNPTAANQLLVYFRFLKEQSFIAKMIEVTPKRYSVTNCYVQNH